MIGFGYKNPLTVLLVNDFSMRKLRLHGEM